MPPSDLRGLAGRAVRRPAARCAARTRDKE